MRPIKKGEELFANYGYSEGPSWYKELRKEFVKQQKLERRRNLEKEQLETKSEILNDLVWFIGIILYFK